MIEINSTIKIFAVYKGCAYEGGSCLREVFSTEEKARNCALELIDKCHQTDLHNKAIFEAEGVDFEIGEWVEKKHNYWSDEYTVIAVKEFILVS